MAVLDTEDVAMIAAVGCCIYVKPRLFDESSSEESEGDDPKHKHKHRKQKAKHDHDCPMHDHDAHGHDADAKQGMSNVKVQQLLKVHSLIVSFTIKQF